MAVYGRYVLIAKHLGAKQQEDDNKKFVAIQTHSQCAQL
jgi:hypothetical protein